MKAKITERGWPGHCIVADRCLFRRNTLVELNGTRVVVSTVGALYDRQGRLDSIGSDRWYETTAHHALDDGPYVGIDVEREISIEGKQRIGADEYQLPNVDNIANDMHDAVVREIAENVELAFYTKVRERLAQSGNRDSENV